MKKIKKIILLILIVLVISFIIIINYAKFIHKESKPNIENNDILGKLEVIFSDTSNVSIVNAYPSKTLSKIFSIKNITDEILIYSIKFNDVINNYINKDDLVYNLKSTNGGAYISENIMPSNNQQYIANNIIIKPNETQKYTMTITFLKTNEDQNDNLNKTFSSNIKIDLSENNNKDNNTLYNRILSHENIKSEQYISNNEIDNLFYTNNSINGNTIYFYRGNNDINNNVIFAGLCWKIVRTTENKGVKLIYNGEYNMETGSCGNSKNILENTSSFNTKSNYNAYVGYMYGNVNSNNYQKEHDNITSSQIKNELDKFYVNNLSKYSKYIEDDYYCGNRKTSKFTLNKVLYGTLGYGNNNTGYISMKNNIINNSNNTYSCYNKNDIYTVNNINGNGKLTNPIGLITLDELIYAGYTKNEKNINNFLYSNEDYWTMTPALYNGNDAYNFAISKGKITYKKVSEIIGIRPVITLKNDVVVSSGNGSNETPYIIK